MLSWNHPKCQSVDTGWFCATFCKDLEQGDPFNTTTTKRHRQKHMSAKMMNATGFGTTIPSMM
jgi:hypothetical protein